MTQEDFIKGLAGLNKPDQGMRYHGGGFDHDAPSFDERTGERLSPVHRAAELTVYGDRARFLYRLIEKADELAATLSAPQPLQGGYGEFTPITVGSKSVPLQGGEVTGEMVAAVLKRARIDTNRPGGSAWIENRDALVDAILALISPAQREGEG